MAIRFPIVRQHVPKLEYDEYIEAYETMEYRTARPHVIRGIYGIGEANIPYIHARYETWAEYWLEKTGRLPLADVIHDDDDDDEDYIPLTIEQAIILRTVIDCCKEATD